MVPFKDKEANQFPASYHGTSGTVPWYKKLSKKIYNTFCQMKQTKTRKGKTNVYLVYKVADPGVGYQSTKAGGQGGLSYDRESVSLSSYKTIMLILNRQRNQIYSV